MASLLQKLELALRGSASSPTPRKRSRAVKVKSRYLEDEDEDLTTAVTTLERPTMAALQKQIRAAGFKGALVHGISSSSGSGFIVTYRGEQFRFNIEEA